MLDNNLYYNNKRIKYYNMDCFEGMNYLKDNSIDYIFTSPPYDRKRNDKYAHFNDKDYNWYELIVRTINESLRLLKDDGVLLLNIQKTYYNKKDFFKLLGKYNNKIFDMFVWNKTSFMPSPNKVKKNGKTYYSFSNCFEYFIIITKKGQPVKSKNPNMKNLFTTTTGSNRKYKGHGAIMRKEACEFFFKNIIEEGTTVLDPFFGSGTTGIVASKYNCDCIGFELTKEYCELAKERIEDEL